MSCILPEFVFEIIVNEQEAMETNFLFGNASLKKGDKGTKIISKTLCYLFNCLKTFNSYSITFFLSGLDFFYSTYGRYGYDSDSVSKVVLQSMSPGSVIVRVSRY